MKGIAVLLCVVSLAFVAPATGSARPVEHFTLDLSGTFFAGLVSRTCGFDVTGTVSVNPNAVNVTLFYDESGNIVREIDTIPAGHITFTAVATGKSVTYPIAGAIVFTDYPEGAFIGAPAIVEFHGNPSHLRGAFLSPGVHIFRATVVDFIQPEGIPLTLNDELIESHGQSDSPDENISEICEALSDP